MANKMADKKRNTSRQATRANLKTNEKDQPVKSISAMARDERQNVKEQTKAENTSSVKSISAMARDKVKNAKEQTQVENTSSVKSISSMARDERQNVKEQTKAESKPSVKASTTALRNEPKKERITQESKVRRESRVPAWFLRFRNSRIGRFVFDAYYELRHKVTWPTFEEARNMTLIVIVLSGIIGGALALIDFGLYHLFLLISGG